MNDNNYLVESTTFDNALSTQSFGTDKDFIHAIQHGKDMEMKADLWQCCLYAMWQMKAESECGGVNTKAYKERSANFMEELKIKKSQLMKNVQIGKFILANKETKPEILEMAKTNIYLTYINPPKLPDPNKPKKPKKPTKLDLLQAENEKLKADLETFRSKMQSIKSLERESEMFHKLVNYLDENKPGTSDRMLTKLGY